MDPALEAGRNKADADVRPETEAGAAGAEPQRVKPTRGPDGRFRTTGGTPSKKAAMRADGAPAGSATKIPVEDAGSGRRAATSDMKPAAKERPGARAVAEPHVWPEDIERLQGILGRLHETFGADLSDFHLSRSMPQAPIDTVQAGIGRVTPSGIKAVLAAVGEEASVTNATFTVTVRLLPERAEIWSAREGARGPYDKGRAPAAKIRDVLQRLKGSKGIGLKLHDNLYGRSAELIEKDEGCFVVRTVSPVGLHERRRMTVPEIAFLVEKGWWTV